MTLNSLMNEEKTEMTFYDDENRQSCLESPVPFYEKKSAPTEKEIDCLREESVFKPGTASLQDHMKNGHGELEEGVRTTMKIGDWQGLRPGDWQGLARVESSVDIKDYEYFDCGHLKIIVPLNQMAPPTLLLPPIDGPTDGTADTKAGGWRVLYETDKSQLGWAAGKLVKMKRSELQLTMNQDLLPGSAERFKQQEERFKQHEERFKKIVTDLLPGSAEDCEQPVIIVLQELQLQNVQLQIDQVRKLQTKKNNDAESY